MGRRLIEWAMEAFIVLCTAAPRGPTSYVDLTVRAVESTVNTCEFVGHYTMATQSSQ